MFLAETGYDPAMGARPLRRTIQTLIEDELSEKILYGEIPHGAGIAIDVEGEGRERKLTFEWHEPQDQIEAAEEPAAIES